jgi:carbonic anhydrase
VNVSQTTIVRDAWARNQRLTVHGWIYGLQDGLLRDLGVCGSGEAEINANYEAAVAA